MEKEIAQFVKKEPKTVPESKNTKASASKLILKVPNIVGALPKV
jgi:hypothetical protein